MPRHFSKMGQGVDGYAAGVGHDSGEGMMSSNKSEMSNLPKEVIMKPYPKIHSYMPENLDDSIVHVDKQMDGDNKKRAMGVPRKA